MAFLKITLYNLFMEEKLKKEIILGQFSGDKVVEFGITHLKYDDCNENDLIQVTAEDYLHKKCAIAFEQMQKAALKEGINIFVVSGFRSKQEQIEVFSRKFKDRAHPTDEEMAARMVFSAPPGFSEHHTGFAVDINSIEDDFKDDIAYAWLLQNALKFGFENSFPQNNWQNVGFEPWHWRYIQDEVCLKIFQHARK